MSSFNLTDLNFPGEKENRSFRKYSQKGNDSKQKFSRVLPDIEPFKKNSNRILINKTYSQELSFDFLDSIDKCLKSSFFDSNVNENEILHNQISRNTNKNSYFQQVLFPIDFLSQNMIEENFMNKDSLLHKTNINNNLSNFGALQDSAINKILDAKSFEGESSLLNQDNDFQKVDDDRKVNQNDTCLYQIEQILQNFEEEEDERKNKTIFVEKISPLTNAIENKYEEHIMIVNEDVKNLVEEKTPHKKKKKKFNKCKIF